MKILLVLLLANGFCFSQKNTAFMEADIISSIPFDTMYLVKGIIPYKDENLVDSAIVEKGKIQFKFEVYEASYYVLRSAISKGVHLMNFVAAPGETIAFKWNISSLQPSTITFTKSKMNLLLNEKVVLPAKFVTKKMNAAADSLYRNSEQLDSMEKVKFHADNKFWSDSLQNIYISFIRNYPKEFASLSYLKTFSHHFNEQFITEFHNQLPPHLKSHSLAKDFFFKKNTIEKISNFSQFPLETVSGKLFNYSAYDNYVVLVDFWASWCKFCISNFPKVDSIRLKFQNKGLKILGISIDENKEAWVNALQREKLPWENLLEPKGVKGMTPIYFNISYIPRYVLIGKNGVILNKDVQLVNAEEEIAKALKDATVNKAEK